MKGYVEVIYRTKGEKVRLLVPNGRPKKGESPAEALARRTKVAKKAYKASV